MRLGDDDQVFAAGEPFRQAGLGVSWPIADGFPCLAGPSLARWNPLRGAFSVAAGGFSVVLDGTGDSPALIARVDEPGIYTPISDAGVIDGHVWFVGKRVAVPWKTLPRRCRFVQPLGVDGWICDGVVLSADGGVVAVADRWLDTPGGLLSLRQGVISLLESPTEDAGNLLASVPEVSAWSADGTGVSIATETHFILCSFDGGCADGGTLRYAGQRFLPGVESDAGVVFLARLDGETFFSRYQWVRPVCRVPDRVCSPAELTNPAEFFDPVARTFSAFGTLFSPERPVETLYGFGRADGGWALQSRWVLPYRWRTAWPVGPESRARAAAAGPAGTLVLNTDPRRYELELFDERGLVAGTSPSHVWFLDEDAGVTRVYLSPLR